jgi:hypothetical protein
MISGLRGLDEELATLPLRECWIPCTMDVCRWWPYDDDDDDDDEFLGSMKRSRTPPRARPAR